MANTPIKVEAIQIVYPDGCKTQPGGASPVAAIGILQPFQPVSSVEKQLGVVRNTLNMAASQTTLPPSDKPLSEVDLNQCGLLGDSTNPEQK
ncbi:hypothetical protein A3C26_01280 [Candidatus Daviesbacteria bacterium RIFCSPHIGHO2_02_FULL_39_12]|uniref:Uncharacterized protein n=2 Tax=Candidatus Daviesiibacteriota TaxID=1752718 RepID=A0A1F5JBK1_9BACT|nr:MAG: hypothetical protein A3C26_01280 [Candidatus Daviesbacteria bacterium RIFCSPHIGHO2_02_FULL_39_12]OGE72728.1 MAG: hypothetical protein A3H40_03195 [Candidatus Daviesbacteria bacterium RIFCSPLOWO2_02_FULL_38_15]